MADRLYEASQSKLEWFNEWSQIEMDLLDVGQRYVDFHNSASKEITNGHIQILNSAITALYVNKTRPLDPDTKMMLLNNHDIVKLNRIQKYSMYNSFVHMKFVFRKYAAYIKEQNAYRLFFISLLKRIKILEQSKPSTITKKREHKKMEHYLQLKYKINNILEWDLSDRMDMYKYLPVMFGPMKMSKNNFLSLLGINKDLITWDREENRTMEFIAELPTEIGIKEFQNAVLICKIESDSDDCFFKIMLKEIMDAIDSKAFDPFKALSDVTGKSIRTFTAEKDVYGEIVSVVPNKPNLEVVKQKNKSDAPTSDSKHQNSNY